MSILLDLNLAAAGIVLIWLGVRGMARQARRRGRDASNHGHRVRVWAGLGRSPFAWISVRLPGGFRIGHRL